MIQISKTFSTEMKAGTGERAVVARISTTAVDRDGDVMIPSGLDAQEYNRNPVVLLAHDQGLLPIGRVAKIEKDSNTITAKVIFAERPASHPVTEEWVPDTVLELFRQKILNAFSVGFIIDDARAAGTKDYGKFGEKVRRIISKWRMVELSVVPVPANQDALAISVSKSWLGRHGWGVKKKCGLSLALPAPLRVELPQPLRLSVG